MAVAQGGGGGGGGGGGCPAKMRKILQNLGILSCKRKFTGW